MTEQPALTEQDSADLDLDVHSGTVRTITTNGLDAQIRFLLTAISPDEVEAALRHAARA